MDGATERFVWCAHGIRSSLLDRKSSRDHAQAAEEHEYRRRRGNGNAPVRGRHSMLVDQLDNQEFRRAIQGDIRC